MKDIVLIQGITCSGKTTLVNELTQDESYHRMVSYTTRPMRKGEVGGVDYHFITEDEFHALASTGKLIERTSYEIDDNTTWYYGFGLDSLAEGKINVGVVNIGGIQQFMQFFRNNLDRILIITMDNHLPTSIKRYNERLDENSTVADRAEAFNRLCRDIRDLDEFNSGYDAFFWIYHIMSGDEKLCCDVIDEYNLRYEKFSGETKLVSDALKEYINEKSKEVYHSF